MNPNIEYEKFTQEIYQELVNADVLKTTDVQHNIKLKGRSGQEVGRSLNVNSFVTMLFNFEV